MNKTLSLGLTLALSTALIAIPAQADHRHHKTFSSHSKKHYRHDSHHFYDYARVRSVTPIYESVEYRKPSQCYSHSSYRHSSEHKSSTPVVLGTIIGAAIGNELGNKKRNKQVGAVAGGILGASIGKDISNKNKHNKRHYEEHYCDDYYTEYEERIVGYKVRYHYRGHTYHTRTHHHPGKRIKLRLNFSPAY